VVLSVLICGAAETRGDAVGLVAGTAVGRMSSAVNIGRSNVSTGRATDAGGLLDAALLDDELLEAASERTIQKLPSTIGKGWIATGEGVLDDVETEDDVLVVCVFDESKEVQ
jgi:hypothetical protein